ncbi:MAG: T9SS type A sorting domain-containing protein [Chitinophagaceae bacterium]
MKNLYLFLCLLVFSIGTIAQSPQTISVTLSPSSPTYNRPVPNGTSAPTTLSGNMVPYSSFSFTAPVAGTYTFTAIGNVVDNFGSLYLSPFNPATPLSNCLIANDNGSSASAGDNFTISYYLNAGATYTLVNSTFYVGEYGTFNVVITGPFTTPLPVEINNFYAQLNTQNQVELRWVTLTEKNSSHFIVQRSVNGLDFEDIATIHSKAVNGNSESLISYQCIDKLPFSVNYYRLVQVDINGNMSFNTAILKVETQAVSTIQLFPIPANDYINARFHTDKPSEALFTIYDYTGKVVLNKRYISSVGINQQSIQLSSLPIGNYMLECTINGSIKHKQKITKY